MKECYEKLTVTHGTNREDKDWFEKQVKIIMSIGKEKLRKAEDKDFYFDEPNRKLIEFLIYYFNDDVRAKSIFPEKEYDLTKNIMIYGGLGVGKNTLMDIFQQYLSYINKINKHVSEYADVEYVPQKEYFDYLLYPQA